MVSQAFVFVVLGIYILTINVSMDGNYFGFTGRQIAEVVGSGGEPAELSDLKFLFFSTGLFLAVLGILEFILLGSTLMFRDKQYTDMIFGKNETCPEKRQN